MITAGRVQVGRARSSTTRTRFAFSLCSWPRAFWANGTLAIGALSPV